MNSKLFNIKKKTTFGRRVGENHFVEASIFTKNSELVWKVGLASMYYKGYFSLKAAIAILSVDIDFAWRGDHPGFYLMIDTPWLEILDFEYYDTRHEEVIEKDKV